MSTDTRSRRLTLLGAATAGLLGLGVLAVPTAPANAQFYFGVGPGGVDFGVAPPPPAYYYPHYYWHHNPYYYRPYYYGW
jgi:hypothetical protein